MEFDVLGLEGGDPGFVGFDGFVIRIVCGEAAEVGGQVAEPFAEGFEGEDDAGDFRRLVAQGIGLRAEIGEVFYEVGFESGVVRRTQTGEPGIKGPAVGSGGWVGAHEVRGGDSGM